MQKNIKMNLSMLQEIPYKCEFCGEEEPEYVYDEMPPRSSPGWDHYVMCENCLIINILLGITTPYTKIRGYKVRQGKGLTIINIYNKSGNPHRRSIRIDGSDLRQRIMEDAAQLREFIKNEKVNSI